MRNESEIGISVPLEKFSCEQCYQIFESKQAHLSHMGKHDLENDRYRCQLCEISFKSRGELVQHTSDSHVNSEGKFICWKCEKFWAKSQPFREHLRYAHGQMKHECGECGKKFTRSDKLQQHILSHTKLRPFTVEI